MWLNGFAQTNRGSLPELSRFPVRFVLRLTSDLEGKGGVTEVSSSHESFIISLQLNLGEKAQTSL